MALELNKLTQSVNALGENAAKRFAELNERLPVLNFAIPALLLLASTLIRTHKVDAFPLFYDEASHIRWAKLVWAGEELIATYDGKILQIWLLAAFWPFTGALWLSRTIMALTSVLGVVFLMRAGSLLDSAEAGWFASGLYLLTPFTFFFDRMAFTEPVQVVFVAALLWASPRLVESDRKRWILLTGGLLYLLLITKVLNILWTGIPAFALVLLRGNWRRPLLNVARAYVFFLALMTLTLLLLYWRGKDFGLAPAQRGLEVSSYTVIFINHLQSLLEGFPFYIPATLLATLAISIGAAVVFRLRFSFFLLASALVPAVALLVGTNRFEMRYFYTSYPPLILLAGIGLRLMLARLVTGYRLAVALLLVIVLLATGTADFFSAGWNSPLQLNLGPRDTALYITENPGAAIPAIVNFVQSAASVEPVDLVVTSASYINYLTTYMGPEPHLYTFFDYDEPALRMKVYYAGLDHPFISLADPCRLTFVLGETPRDTERLNSITVPVELVFTAPWPDGDTSYLLYRANPTDSVLEMFAPQGCR